MIPFIDLAAQRARIGDRIDAAIARVLDHGAFIMGPEVAQLEDSLANYCGARHAIGCSSGTDALLLALMSLGVTRGDAVLVPSFTFVATAEVVALLGATPVFLDVEEDHFCLDAGSLDAGAAAARRHGLRPAGVIVVDLFGQPANYGEIEAAAADFDMWVVCDAAQSFGASYRGRRVGTIGRLTTTSFYPAKPLGCYGDAGALFTDDDELAGAVRSILVHGTGKNKYDNVRIGINGRLDTLQAAILLEKLAVFDDEVVSRNEVAEAYSRGLSMLNAVAIPRTADGATSTWAQYTLRLEGVDRGRFCAQLRENGVPTAIHYPQPLHRQPAYRHFPAAGNGLDVSARLSESVVSLPMHAYLDEPLRCRVIDAVHAAVR